MSQKYSIVCFSHLRWDFVFQRPQHLLTRCSKERPVYYFEEPIFTEATVPEIKKKTVSKNLFIVTPHIPNTFPVDAIPAVQKDLLHDFIKAESIELYVAWYYTPMALKFTRELTPVAVVYDCMDELTHFKFAPRN